MIDKLISQYLLCSGDCVLVPKWAYSMFKSLTLPSMALSRNFKWWLIKQQRLRSNATLRVLILKWEKASLRHWLCQTVVKSRTMHLILLSHALAILSWYQKGKVDPSLSRTPKIMSIWCCTTLSMRPSKSRCKHSGRGLTLSSQFHLSLLSPIPVAQIVNLKQLYAESAAEIPSGKTRRSSWKILTQIMDMIATQANIDTL